MGILPDMRHPGGPRPPHPPRPCHAPEDHGGWGQEGGGYVYCSPSNLYNTHFSTRGGFLGKEKHFTISFSGRWCLKGEEIFHHHQKIFSPLGGAWGKKQGMKGEAVGAWAGEMGEQVQLNKRHIGIMWIINFDICRNIQMYKIHVMKKYETGPV